mmetsp:Transcript_24472/g.76724  ORF Transcript_24472/g.76724 Transcript_24472/m.76724 type:complete len:126 (-) Transcript_24472:218-595(-)
MPHLTLTQHLHSQVETEGAPGSNYEAMLSALPNHDCRYAVYDHDFTTHDGRRTSKLYFISWMPNNSTRHNKMAYSEMKRKVATRFTGTFDIQAQDEADLLLGMHIITKVWKRKIILLVDQARTRT